MWKEEWQITGTRISSKSAADVYYGEKTVRIPGEMMVSYFLADPYEMFWLETEDREILPWNLPEERRRNRLSETEKTAVMKTVSDGRYKINGFRNKDVRHHILPGIKDRKKQSANQ